jgi:hypothetical protein
MNCHEHCFHNINGTCSHILTTDNLCGIVIWKDQQIENCSIKDKESQQLVKNN